MKRVCIKLREFELSFDIGVEELPYAFSVEKGLKYGVRYICIGVNSSVVKRNEQGSVVVAYPVDIAAHDRVGRNADAQLNGLLNLSGLILDLIGHRPKKPDQFLSRKGHM